MGVFTQQAQQGPVYSSIIVFLEEVMQEVVTHLLSELYAELYDSTS